MKLLTLLPAMLLIVSCSSSPSESDVQTAIAQTAVALPTIAPTLAPVETSTPVPSPTPDCLTTSEPIVNDLEPLLLRWEDATDLANNTSRVSLAGPVAELQAIRQEVEQLQESPCAPWITRAPAEAMGLEIDGYLSFMADEGDTVVDYNFLLADGAWAAYQETASNTTLAPDEFHTTYVAYATVGTLDIAYRGSDGEIVEEEWVESPFVAHRVRPAGETASMTINRVSAYDFVVCAIYVNGLLAAIETDAGETVELTCSFQTPPSWSAVAN